MCLIGILYMGLKCCCCEKEGRRLDEMEGERRASYE